MRSDHLTRDIAAIGNVLDAGRRAEEAGKWDEALAIYQGELERWQPEGGAPASELLRKIGVVHYYRGDLELALNLFESSHRIAAQHRATGLCASALNCIAIVRQEAGQLDQAEDLYAEAQLLALQAGDARLVAMIDQNLGTVASIRGDTAVALQRYQTALLRSTALGDDLSVARVLTNIGSAHVDVGAFSAAETAFDEALALAERVADTELLATLQLNRAELYMKLDRFDDARACCDQAFEIFARLESKSGLGETYQTYGKLFRRCGKLHLAEAHLSLVAELAEAADHPLLEAEAESEYALVHLARGRSQAALRSLNRAHRLFSDLKARRDLVDVDRQLDKLEHSYVKVTQAWAESIESTDRHTAGHSARVADLTCRLAEQAGFSGRELVWVRMGALLHDIGKLEVNPAMAGKSAVLDPRECEEVRKHTIAGDEIVAGLEFPYDIRPMVRSHHERWDGQGYPDQLAGEQIPLMARILALADVYDVLTTPRSNHVARTPEEAIALMKKESGGIFDPELFLMFKRLLLGK